jgi:hypothetical protein
MFLVILPHFCSQNFFIGSLYCSHHRRLNLDLGKFIALVRHLRWSLLLFLFTVDSPNPLLPPGHRCASYHRRWTRRPTSPPLHPLTATTRSFIEDPNGVHHLRLVLLYAIRYFIIIGDLHNVGQPSNRHRGRVSGNLSGELFRWTILVH